MRKVCLLGFALILALASASSAETYAGVKSGFMMIDVEGVDNIIPIGGFFGMTVAPNISIEGEFNYGISGGDWEPVAGVTTEFNIWTVAGYGVYRFHFSEAAYLKAKVGVLHENLEAEVSGSIEFMGETYTYSYDLSGSDTGLSFGVGGGFNLNPSTMIEAEYTLIEQDISFLSVGLGMAF